MNLKEAFRYQNKLRQLMDEARNILGLERNVTKVENTTCATRSIPTRRMRPPWRPPKQNTPTKSRKSPIFSCTCWRSGSG